MYPARSAFGRQELNANNLRALRIRKQSTNKVVSLGNDESTQIIRPDLDEQRNEEVDFMIKRNENAEKNEKPVSDDASSVGTSSKSDPFHFHRLGHR